MMPTATKLISEDLAQINQKMEEATLQEVLVWAWDTYQDSLIVSSSFQTQSVPLLHAVSQVIPQTPILFVDTGFHFPETLQFMDELVERLDLNLIVVRPDIFGDEFTGLFGPLYLQNADACCFYNKVVPFQLKLREYRAWITGIRRDQTENRETASVVGQHPFLAVVKINPLVNWSTENVIAYIKDHNLPFHPLWEQGYRSIGCQPCTRPVGDGEYERDGRWSHCEKNECGVHTL